MIDAAPVFDVTFAMIMGTAMKMHIAVMPPLSPIWETLCPIAAAAPEEEISVPAAMPPAKMNNNSHMIFVCTCFHTINLLPPLLVIRKQRNAQIINA